MDKETLSNYGWIVICVLVLAVMIALATPFGTFVADAVKSTTQGLFNVNQAALGSAGIDVNDMVFENCDHLETEVRNATDTYTGDTFCKACGKVLIAGEKVVFAHNGEIVPEGGKYTAADGTVYNPGDKFPETVTTGDKYAYGDYTYMYNGYWQSNSMWDTNENQNGWGVKCINYDTSAPSAILESINGEPINTMTRTFISSKLTTVPDFPSNVTALYKTFEGCKSLVVAPEIPDCIKSMGDTFRNCTALTTAPIIPDGVTYMDSIFWGCTSLKTYVGSTDPDGDFSNYIIPNNITDMSYAFKECTSLTVAPNLGHCKQLKWVYHLFNGCTSLSGTIEISRSASGQSSYVTDNPNVTINWIS